MKTVAVIGSGSWGTALAIQLHTAGNKVILWSFKESEATAILTDHENKEFLPGIHIPEDITVTCKDEDVSFADMLIFATPSKFARNMLTRFKPYIKKDQIIVNVAKGLEEDTLMCISEVMHQVAPQARIAVLSGPSHAEEVGRGMATTVVAASKDPAVAKEVQETFMSPMFRVYTSCDILGVQLGGALKNLIALAAGAADGCGFGDNTKAALMTRGIAEIARLGTAMGANEKTFAGLTGIGDLIVTCTSQHSRNRRAGVLLGQGKKLEDVLEEVHMVVEGVVNAKAAYMLSKKYNVEMPITSIINDVLYNGLDVKEAVYKLMTRDGIEE
ncbi:MAG: NAD(P)H-dependent glycerol-3-phosphate dehydrogenase [Firmicutes bacterium]|nr:NAD(P)H-dependent glycerol-3-phosphate dehydrogenase [Bacillota bacterium]MBQ9604291.1 NAD(P)H-dependent glycerol-3-phosphate dehydrogenase [Bacillota bacterium]